MGNSLGMKWKADRTGECSECNKPNLPIMNCAELGELCKGCFETVMEENFPTEL